MILPVAVVLGAHAARGRLIKIHSLPIIVSAAIPLEAYFRSLASEASPADIRKVCACVRLRSEHSEPTMFSQTTPDEHPPTPPPCRWPSIITLPTLAKFQLVWRRLCEALLSSSSLALQKHPYLLSRLSLNVGDVTVVLP